MAQLMTSLMKSFLPLPFVLLFCISQRRRTEESNEEQEGRGRLMPLPNASVNA